MFCWACTVTGAVAMLSQKQTDRHPGTGRSTFCAVVGVFLSATGLAAARWAEGHPLFIL
jgi:hypothetical protein